MMGKGSEPMSMSCAEVRELLPAYARDRDASLSVRRHLSGCKDCRAELSRYEELLGAMASLRSVTAELPEANLAAIVGIPANPYRLQALRGVAGKTTELVASHRSAVLGGVAAAALAGAGALVWRQRARRIATA